MTSPEKLRRLEDLFHRCVDLPPEERETFLTRECGSDAALRARLAAMLVEDEREGPFETPLLVADEEAGKLSSGERLGPCRVERRIGAGGMGTVYLGRVEEAAEGLRRGDRVALKVLHAHLLSRKGFRERFLREAEAGSRVVHENVVRTLGAGVSGESCYLLTEYVEGRTLRDLLSELEAVPEALVREIAVQAAAGLAAIHAAGIVHRDLKPENVLITRDHRVRIMDLGVSRRLDDSAGLTRDGQFVGTLHYAAPEQFGEGEIGPAADLYSLGVLLYELSTGENPFRADRLPSVMRAQLERVPPPACERNRDVSPFLSELLAALLAKEPPGRLRSAKVLGEVLARGEESQWWLERQLAAPVARSRRPDIPVRRETGLYGRETDLALLRESWGRAREGEGNAVLLEGEAGIGKTRLVDAFASRLEGDATVLYGSYSPAGGAGGLSDAVLAHFGAPALGESLRPYLTVTPSLVSAFSALLKGEAPPAGAPGITGEALHAVFVHLMRALAEVAPLLWVVEDLHFASEDSRKVALSLARALAGRRVMLLLTTRPGLPEEVASLFTRLSNLRRMSLGRLSPREVVRLLRDAFRSERLAERLGGKIAYKSDGVPFFVFEMIRGLREGQFIEELPDGTWVESKVIEEIEVPSAVRDLIEARLRGLLDEERSLLDLASVLGYEFDPDLMARARRLPRVEVLERLATVERRSGVVKGMAGRCRFDHHQIQEVVYEGLMPDLRAEYHTLLGEAFAGRTGVSEARPEDVPGEDARFLAEHHLRGRSPESALPFLDTALTHLSRACRSATLVELSDLALDVEGLLDGRERVEVMIRKAEGLDRLGERERQREVVEDALEAADATDDPDLRAKARFNLAWCLSEMGATREAQRTYESALTLSVEGGNRMMEGKCLGQLSHVLMVLGRYEEARDRVESHMAVSQEAGDRPGESRSWIRLANVLRHTGRLQEALEGYARGFTMLSDLGDHRNSIGALMGLGNVEHQLGRFEKAKEYFQRGLALARESGCRSLEPGLLTGLGIVSREAGQSADALRCLLEAIELSRQNADRRCEASASHNLGNLLELLGRPSEARGHCESAVVIARETGERIREGGALLSSARLAYTEKDPAGSRSLLEEAVSLCRKLGEKHLLAIALGSFGELEKTLGRIAPAVAHADESLALARDIDVPGMVLLATVLRATLPGGDPDAAVALLPEKEGRLGLPDRMEARYRLFEATKDPAHLEEAHRLLCQFRDHAPEEYRESMIMNVPLHRDIMKAWEEHTGGTV